MTAFHQVRAAGKVKIDGNIVENPSDADLLQASLPANAPTRTRLGRPGSMLVDLSDTLPRC